MVKIELSADQYRASISLEVYVEGKHSGNGFHYKVDSKSCFHQISVNLGRCYTLF